MYSIFCSYACTISQGVMSIVNYDDDVWHIIIIIIITPQWQAQISGFINNNGWCNLGHR